MISAGFMCSFLFYIAVFKMCSERYMTIKTEPPNVCENGSECTYCIALCRQQHLLYLPCLTPHLCFPVTHMIREKFITQQDINIHCLPFALNHKPHCPKAYFVCKEEKTETACIPLPWQTKKSDFSTTKHNTGFERQTLDELQRIQSMENALDILMGVIIYKINAATHS